MENITRAERTLYGLALIMAPLLLAISTFFWQGDQVGMTGGMIQVYAFVLWIPAMLGLLRWLRPVLPGFAVWGVLLVSWSCIAGDNFGMEGIFRASFAQAGADATQLAALQEAMRVPELLVLNLPGSSFPLTLLILGFLLWRHRRTTPWLALLLCLGAITFPASRIPRIELLAHLADLLLLVAAGGMGWQMLQGTQGEITAQGAPRAVGAGDD